jgi:hypothetical protein
MVPVLISPFLQPFAFFPTNESLLPILGIPHLMLVVRMFVRTCPWLMIDAHPLPLTSPSPFPPPNGLLQFTLHVFKDDISNQVHSLKQYLSCVRIRLPIKNRFLFFSSVIIQNKQNRQLNFSIACTGGMLYRGTYLCCLFSCLSLS